MFTNKEIHYSCPKCQGNFTVKMSQITNNEIIECPTCKTEIRLDDKRGKGKKKPKSIIFGVSRMNQEKDDSLKDLRDNISKLPFHRFLGLSPESFDIENGCIHFDMRDELVGNTHFRILHGGAIASILDTEGAFVLAIEGAWRPEVGSSTNPPLKGGTIDLRIDYLRPGKGDHFVASGAILRLGNKVGVVHTELRNEQDELIATGTGTYLVG